MKDDVLQVEDFPLAGVQRDVRGRADVACRALHGHVE